MQVQYVKTIRKPLSIAGEAGLVRELPIQVAQQFIREGYVVEWFPPVAPVAEPIIKKPRPKLGVSNSGEETND